MTTSDNRPDPFLTIWAESESSIKEAVFETADEAKAIHKARASMELGFPPITMKSAMTGGVPPWGKDHNGILNRITESLQWIQAGGTAIYDDKLCKKIGGYPEGTILQDINDSTILWFSIKPNNTFDPVKTNDTDENNNVIFRENYWDKLSIADIKDLQERLAVAEENIATNTANITANKNAIDYINNIPTNSNDDVNVNSFPDVYAKLKGKASKHGSCDTSFSADTMQASKYTFCPKTEKDGGAYITQNTALLQLYTGVAHEFYARATKAAVEGDGGAYTIAELDYELEYQVEVDDQGNPKTDTDGNPILKTDTDGNPIPKTDTSGNPVLKTDTDGNPIPQRYDDGHLVLKTYKKGPNIGKIVCKDLVYTDPKGVIKPKCWYDTKNTDKATQEEQPDIPKISDDEKKIIIEQMQKNPIVQISSFTDPLKPYHYTTFYSNDATTSRFSGGWIQFDTTLEQRQPSIYNKYEGSTAWMSGLDDDYNYYIHLYPDGYSKFETKTHINFLKMSISDYSITAKGPFLNDPGADLAEYYLADRPDYEPGTLMCHGVDTEVTLCQSINQSDDFFGVVSTSPAYIMNGKGKDETNPVLIALNGKVPVKVKGVVKRGDKITIGQDGYGVVSQNKNDVIVGRAKESKVTEEVGLVSCYVQAHM